MPYNFSQQSSDTATNPTSRWDKLCCAMCAPESPVPESLQLRPLSCWAFHPALSYSPTFLLLRTPLSPSGNFFEQESPSQAVLLCNQPKKDDFPDHHTSRHCLPYLALLFYIAPVTRLNNIFLNFLLFIHFFSQWRKVYEGGNCFVHYYIPKLPKLPSSL